PAVDMQRAGSALPDAAAELRARQPDVIADHPQQGRLRIGIDRMSRSVNVQIERHTLPPLDPEIAVDASGFVREDSKFTRRWIVISRSIRRRPDSLRCR